MSTLDLSWAGPGLLLMFTFCVNVNIFVELFVDEIQIEFQLWVPVFDVVTASAAP